MTTCYQTQVKSPASRTSKSLLHSRYPARETLGVYRHGGRNDPWVNELAFLGK
jgi:hypothetical protein